MQTISLILDANEQAVFEQIIDLALRHAGSAALDAAAHFKARLASARLTATPAAAPPTP